MNAPRPVERIKLHENAGKIWRKSRQAIREAVGDVPGDFVIGGGAVLIARFGHRVSIDIDLRVPGADNLRELKPDRQAGQRLKKRIEAAGGEVVETGDENEVVLGFEDGQVDLMAGEMYPTERARIGIVENEPEAVASTRQILAMKIAGRGLNAPIRDLYDCAVAARMDREALAGCMNLAPSNVLADIYLAWTRRMRPETQDEAKHAIMGAPKEWQNEAVYPAPAAVQAISDVVWRQIEATFTPAGMSLIGTNFNQSKVIEGPVDTREGVEDALARYGIWRGHGRSAVVKTTCQAMDAARAGRVQERAVLKNVTLPGDARREENLRRARGQGPQR